MRGLPAKGTFNQTWEGRLGPGRGQSTLATSSPWPPWPFAVEECRNVKALFEASVSGQYSAHQR